MKFIFLKKILPGFLITAVLVTTFSALSEPKPVQAAGAAACAGGAVVGIGVFVSSTVKDAFGAQTGSSAPIKTAVETAEQSKTNINDCILKPLGQMLVVALIRNIGASVVEWVNSGFEGKPSFITDFAGTLMDSADQAIGNFIENNTDLGWLCGDLSISIRIGLALKYSKPFRREIGCTLSGIGENVENLAKNNGGRGWNNFLQLTTEPQNNVYGAYLIADSELTKRVASAVGVKEKRISIGQGFLDFETCNRYETEDEYWKRKDGGGSFDSQVTNLSGENYKDFDGSAVTPETKTETSKSLSEKRECKEKTISTPGRVIADQLQNEFMTGPVQRAVAEEIDQVVAATLNQLVTMTIQSAAGLLGLSKKSSGSSYLDTYRAQLYGQGSTVTVTTDLGAKSAIDSYRVLDNKRAQELFDPTNPDTKNINDLVNTVGGEKIQQEQGRVQTTIATYSGTTTERNVAFGKPSKQSSGFNNPSLGNDGVKFVSTYTQGAETDPTQSGGWWEVDLGEDTLIKEIRVHKIASDGGEYSTKVANRKGGTDGLTLEIRSSENIVENPTFIGGAANSSEADILKAAVNKKGRYVRITRPTDAADEGYCKINKGYKYDFSCFKHLAFAEIEIFTVVNLQPNGVGDGIGANIDNDGWIDMGNAVTVQPGDEITISSQSSTDLALQTYYVTNVSNKKFQISAVVGGSRVGAGNPGTLVWFPKNTTANDGVGNGTATSTLVWNPSVISNDVVNNSTGINRTISLSANQTVSGIRVQLGLYNSRGEIVAFQSIFKDFDIVSVYNDTTVYLQNYTALPAGNLDIAISLENGSAHSFTIKGNKKANVLPGNYSFITRVIDSTGRFLQDKTQRIDFVVQ